MFKTENIAKAVYTFSMAVGVATLLSTAAFVINMLGRIDETSGNGGAFASILSLGVGTIGIVVMTFFGLVGASVSYLYQDVLPKKIFYKFWWPCLLATPGIAFISISFLKIVINGF